MRAISRRWGYLLIAALVVSIPANLAVADDSLGSTESVRLALTPNADWALAGALALSPSQEPQEERADVTIREESTFDSMLDLDITYYLYSDYIFRGLNRSEYLGEGREKFNHQLTTSLAVDIGMLFGQEAGTCGKFGFDTFFEWYAQQKRLDPVYGGQNLQEVDYTLWWSYDIEPIETMFTLGYTFYVFPNDKPRNTDEWFVNLEHNDAWMWKWMWPDNEEGVLNPSFLFVQDVDETGGGMWMELGVSHDFAICEALTLTPSATAAIDHRYLEDLAGPVTGGSTTFAYVQYGLDAAYDLTPLLKLPPCVDAVTLKGFVYFNDALGNLEDNLIIQDEFFGGMSLGFSF